MENGEASRNPSSQGTCFLDIHQVQEEARKPSRGVESESFSITKHASLEPGLPALEEEGSMGRKVLARKGKSFGGFGLASPHSDFSIFRTKQRSSMLPLRRDYSKSSDLLQVIEEGSRHESVPAGRYFAALRGPELDQVKDSESILVSKHDKWPFLLRFPIGCFGICLGLSSQAILWQALSNSPATRFLHLTPLINLVIWVVALSTLFAASITYALKCMLYFEAVKREFHHPVRVNFFFAPWVVCMFLAIGVPEKLSMSNLHPSVLCIFMAPIILLDLKIYGQWLSGGRRRLCRVANPSSHLSVVGNFVGASLAARVGWEEAGKFMWAVGFAHYLVVFVTLYQRLPTSEALPKELHPVYSMFIATPAAASISWAAIHGGEFDSLARVCYFIALFLCCSLCVRINFFRGFRFSVAWWSYTFPMTTASIATIKYAEAVPWTPSKVLALTLSFTSSTIVSVLFVTTLLHGIIWKTLFPNDLAIAITKTRQTKANKTVTNRKKHGPLPLA